MQTARDGRFDRRTIIITPNRRSPALGTPIAYRSERIRERKVPMARCSRRVLLQLAATQAAALGVLAACGGSAGTSVTSGSVQATLSTAAATQTAASSA